MKTFKQIHESIYGSSKRGNRDCRLSDTFLENQKRTNQRSLEDKRKVSQSNRLSNLLSIKKNSQFFNSNKMEESYKSHGQSLFKMALEKSKDRFNPTPVEDAIDDMAHDFAKSRSEPGKKKLDPEIVADHAHKAHDEHRKRI